jgi:HEPN domain-containing protein
MNERDIVNEWLQIAYDDYDSALFLFDNKHPKPLEIICYHCQQSAEKSLKAFLCAKGAVIPKIHETGLLCHNCVEYDNAFSVFVDDCEELEIYATGTRYPSRIEVEERNAEVALKQAHKIYGFVFEQIRQMYDK